jgi:hypothetical protein
VGRRRKRGKPPRFLRITVAIIDGPGLNKWDDPFIRVIADHRVFLIDKCPTVGDQLAWSGTGARSTEIRKSFTDTLNQWKEAASRLYADYFVKLDC